ncbi:MAG: OmpA family protein [Gemmatimonadales bacterium]|nr:OmpA family protein [Gemmatimonadales bacterium]
MASSQHLIAAVLGVALVSTGCGRKEVAEIPEPVMEAPAPVIPVSTPVAVDRLEPAVDMRPIMEQRIHFALDRSDLTPEARAILAAKVDILRSTPGVTLRIDGHADERGSDEYNLALSKRRAAEAKRFLVARGIDASRLETEGYGEEQPLDRTRSEMAWAMNRRAGFQVIGGAVSQR